MCSKYSIPVFNLSTFLCVWVHQRFSLPTDSNTFSVIIFQSCCQRGAYLSVWKMKSFTVPSNSAWPTPTMMMDMGSLAACRKTNNKQIKGCMLKDENIAFFQLTEWPLRRTRQDKIGVVRKGNEEAEGSACFPSDILWPWVHFLLYDSPRLLSWHGNMCDHCMLAIRLGSTD